MIVYKQNSLAGYNLESTFLQNKEKGEIGGGTKIRKMSRLTFNMLKNKTRRYVIG